MTLEEAIIELNCSVLLHEREADKCARHGGTWYEGKAKAHKVFAKEHGQLAEWLEELEAYRETYGTADRPQGEWTPCSERLPSEDEQDPELGVIVTLGNGYSGLQYDWYHDGHWYDWDGFVVAWRPLPEPWKGADDETSTV